MPISVDVQYACEEGEFPTVDLLTQWVTEALQVIKHTNECELTIRIVDEPEGRELNERWRHKSGATNVLSFPFDSPPGLELSLLGDIVICAPVVSREALEQGKALIAHWAHLVVHGTLHLLQYDHQDTATASIMEDLEIQIMHRLGYPNPY